MTDKELMQQALDALQEYVGVVVSVNDPNDWTPKVADAGEPARKAIEALRARLAQNEFNPDWDAMAVMVEEQQRMAKRIEELENRLAQPEPEELGEIIPADEEQLKRIAKLVEPEPVAWKMKGVSAFATSRPNDTDSIKWDALYTAPPQREWKGLTDEEQTQVAWSCGAMSADWLDFANAIEAKLKEKNT